MCHSVICYKCYLRTLRRQLVLYFSVALSLGQLGVFCQNDSILAADYFFVSHEFFESHEFTGPVNLKTKKYADGKYNNMHLTIFEVANQSFLIDKVRRACILFL